ncbi:MAG: ABC transporter permease [Acidobacteria bacterium]|nr:ABC transporter permease [Acidobacteriota bacterium]
MNFTAYSALVRRDLHLFFQDKRALTMSFAAPILIGSFFGYLFGNAGGGPASKIQVAVIDRDNSAVSRRLIGALAADPALAVTPHGYTEAESGVRAGKITVAAVVPPGFADAAGRAFLRGEGKPEIQLLYDPSHGAEMAMVRGILTQHVMEVVSGEVFGGASSPKLVADAMRDVGASRDMNPADRQALLDILRTVGAWDRRVSANPAGNAAGRGLTLPYTVKEEAVTARKGTRYNSMAHSFAGMSVQFILFMGIDAGLIVLTQRRSGMWKRLQAAPISRWTVIGSRATSAAITAMIILVVVFGFARVVWGVKIEGSVPGFVAVCAAFSVMTATFGLLVAVLGKTPEGARGISILVTLILVMLGGSWVPAFLFPQWLQQVSFLIPTRWAVDGLDGTIWRGFTAQAAMAPTVALLGFAALFAGIAVWRFKWEA